jgi:hypothetical protein
MIRHLRMVRLYVFLGLCVAFSVTTAYGDTPVSGNIYTDTTWSKASSPYIVTGIIQVYPGATLTIDAGTVVRFVKNEAPDPNDKAGIRVGGTLIARGTNDEMILFTSDSPSPAYADWGFIEFTNVSPLTVIDEAGNHVSGNILEFCRLEYGYGVTGETNPFISDCVFDNVTLSLWGFTSIAVGEIDFVVRNSVFNSSSGSAVNLRESNFPTARINVQDCKFNNVSLNLLGTDVKILRNVVDGGKIYFEYQYSTGEIEIDGNVIQNHQAVGDWGGGINVNATKVVITNNKILNNRAYGGGGIVCGGLLELRGNIIAGNVAEYSPSASPSGIGGGILFYGRGNIENNLIVDNVASQGGGAIAYSGQTALYINRNDILNNGGNDILNSTGLDVDATDNWWGTTDISNIESRIWDYYDDFFLGKVIYSPIATLPFLPAVEYISAPNQPSGANNGITETSYSYSTTGSSSSIGHPLEYQFDWKGDGFSDVSTWGPPSQSKVWDTPGTYYVRARARCTLHNDVISRWSEAYQISISIPPPPPPQYLTINIAGPGTVAKNPDKSAYDYGEQVTLTATSNPEYFFDRWGGDIDGTANPYILTMNGNKYVWAYFVAIPPPQYTLTINVIGSGTVGKYPDKATYNHGEQVSLMATPNPGYVFSGWSGDISNNTNLYVVLTMDGNKSITATFSESHYILTVSVSIPGSGTVTINPNKPQYTYGEQVTLTATPNSQYFFRGWGGDLSGPNNPVMVTMNANKRVTSVFSPLAGPPGGWKSIGPKAGSIILVAVDPTNANVVYAVTQENGIFKSIDGGGTWNPVNSGLPNVYENGKPTIQVYALAINPSNTSTLYASAGSYGSSGGFTRRLFKSTDGGKIWSDLGVTLWANGFAIDPSNTNIIYANTIGSGVYRSTNEGTTWITIKPEGGGCGRTYNAPIAVDPSNSNVIYASVDCGLSKSSDGGVAWSPILGNAQTLAIDPSDTNILYAGTMNGVLKSTDGGGIWTAVNSGLPANPSVSDLAVDPSSSTTIYVAAVDSNTGTDGGVFKSTNGGATWTSINNGLGLPTGTYVKALAINPLNTSIVYAGTNIGIFKSSDGGATWGMRIGLISTTVYSIAIDPTNSGIIYTGADVGVFKSTNGGGSWSVSLIYFSIYALAIDPSNTSNIYAATGSSVLKSINGGTWWDEFYLGLKYGASALAIDPIDTRIIYAGSSAGVFKSIDRGMSWETTGLTYSAVSALAIDPSNPSIVYAGTDVGVFKSNDGGGSWSVSLIYTPIYSLALDPSNTSIIYAGTDGYLGGVFKSTDRAGTWNTINAGIADIDNISISSLAIDPSSPSTIYAGGINWSYGVVFKSTNAGGIWTSISEGLPESQVYTLAIDPSNTSVLYAGTGKDAFTYNTYGSIIYVSQDGLCNGKHPCLLNIQDGIASAIVPSSVWITEDTYNENIVFNSDQVITIRGGWDTSFTSASSSTAIQGAIAITNGTMIIENIILK